MATDNRVSHQTGSFSQSGGGKSVPLGIMLIMLTPFLYV